MSRPYSEERAAALKTFHPIKVDEEVYVVDDNFGRRWYGHRFKVLRIVAGSDSVKEVLEGVDGSRFPLHWCRNVKDFDCTCGFHDDDGHTGGCPRTFRPWPNFERSDPPKMVGDYGVGFIRAEVRDLVARGNITIDELKAFRGNSWEQEVIIPALKLDAFIYHVEKNILPNCAPTRLPATVYDDAAKSVFLPEAMRRLVRSRTETNALEDFRRAVVGARREFVRELEAAVGLNEAAPGVTWEERAAAVLDEVKGLRSDHALRDAVGRYIEENQREHNDRAIEEAFIHLCEVFAAPPKSGPPSAAPTPVPMILHCPECRTRHIDSGDFATKPHHTHACQHCGFVWRPAIIDTVGVDFLPGFKDSV